MGASRRARGQFLAQAGRCSGPIQAVAAVTRPVPTAAMAGTPAAATEATVPMEALGMALLPMAPTAGEAGILRRTVQVAATTGVRVVASMVAEGRTAVVVRMVEDTAKPN